MARMEDNFEAAIKETVRRRMNEVAAEELEEMKVRLHTRISKELDGLALQVLERYDIIRDQRGLHIIVTKPVTE